MLTVNGVERCLSLNRRDMRIAHKNLDPNYVYDISLNIVSRRCPTFQQHFCIVKVGHMSLSERKQY